MKHFLQLLLLFSAYVSFAEDSWTAQSSGTTQNLNDIHFVNANSGFVVGNNGTLLETTNGGNNWNSQSIGTSENLNQIYFQNLTTAFILGQNGNLFRSTTSGSSWTSSNIFTGALYGIDFKDDNGIIVGDNGNIFISSDKGANWTGIGSIGVFTINDVCFFNDTLAVAVGASGNIFRSNDKGNTWTAIVSGTVNSLSSIEKRNSTGLFICGTSGEIMEYQPLTNTLTKLSVGLSSNWLKDLSCNDNSCYITGTNKTSLIYSGSSWISRSLDDNVNLNSVSQPFNGTVYLCGIGGVIYKTTEGGFPIGVAKINKNEFLISPNPAQNSVVIKSSTSIQSIQIASITGEIVLVKSSNNTQVSIDVSNLPVGVYVISILTQEGKSASKFMKQ